MGMTQRGRPRHPDILTPREWEVLSLLREGLSNPQIGERLEISADAAKYHVSEILSKLGVSSREEAARWQPEPAAVPVLRPAWARALARGWPALAWAGASAALVGVGVLAWAVLSTNQGDSDSVIDTGTPSASASATSSPASAPSFLSGIPIRPLVIGADLDLPADRALIMLLGCTGCDGPDGGVGRYYHAADGTVHFDRLLWAHVAVAGGEPSNNLGLPPDGDYAVLGAASDVHGAEIIAAVCCTPQTVLFRSTDGGVSWSRYASLDGQNQIYGMTSPGHVLVGTFAFGQSVPYQIVPDGGEITPPSGGEHPFVVAGEIVWRANGGRELIGSAGRVVLPDGGEGTTFYAPVDDSKCQSSAVVLNQSSADANQGYYLVALGSNRAPQTAFVSPDSYIEVSAWLDCDHLLVMASVPTSHIPGTTYAGDFAGFAPAVIDIDTGDIHVITGTMAQPNGQRSILAAPDGPFARVSGADPCLNIRSAPSTDAPVIECVANGVLLFDHLRGDKLTAATPIDGWLDVSTPDGRHGYASTEFLDLAGE